MSRSSVIWLDIKLNDLQRPHSTLDQFRFWLNKFAINEPDIWFLCIENYGSKTMEHALEYFIALGGFPAKSNLYIKFVRSIKPVVRGIVD